jgi:hypothetical protein
MSTKRCSQQDIAGNIDAIATATLFENEPFNGGRRADESAASVHCTRLVSDVVEAGSNILQ